MPESIMAPTFGDLVKREYSRDYCRETVLLVPRPGGYPLGAVLGRITESGKFALSTAKATDGSEMPCAVLVSAATGSAADSEAVAIVRGPVVLVAGGLHIDASLQANKSQVIQQLAAYGIVARQES